MHLYTYNHKFVPRMRVSLWSEWPPESGKRLWPKWNWIFNVW